MTLTPASTSPRFCAAAVLSEQFGFTVTAADL
jgi:hypothetical protein